MTPLTCLPNLQVCWKGGGGWARESDKGRGHRTLTGHSTFFVGYAWTSPFLRGEVTHKKMPHTKRFYGPVALTPSVCILMF